MECLTAHIVAGLIFWNMPKGKANPGLSGWWQVSVDVVDLLLKSPAQHGARLLARTLHYIVTKLSEQTCMFTYVHGSVYHLGSIILVLKIIQRMVSSSKRHKQLRLQHVNCHYQKLRIKPPLTPSLQKPTQYVIGYVFVFGILLNLYEFVCFFKALLEFQKPSGRMNQTQSLKRLHLHTSAHKEESCLSKHKSMAWNWNEIKC